MNDRLQRFLASAAHMAATHPHKPADGLYAILKRELDRRFQLTAEEHQQVVRELARLTGV